MATIVTTTATNPVQWPGNRLVAKVLGVNRWVAMVKGTNANEYLMVRSGDYGASWGVVRTTTRANVTDIGSIYCDNQGWVFWAYRTNESSNDRVYVRRFESDTGSNKPDTGEVMVATAGNGGVAGASLNGLSICSHWFNANGYHYIPVAVGTIRGGLQGISIVAAQIDTMGNISDGTSRVLKGTREFFVSDTAGRVGPSIDKEHNGNGYSAGSSPNLWVTFGRAQLNMVKLTWNGDGWTGPSSATLVRSGLSARDTLPALWDGNRFLMCVPDPVNTDRVLVYERNRANSSTSTRQSPAHTTGVVRQATIAYDYTSGNFRVFAVGTSTAVLYQVDYIRSSDTWGAWTAVSGSPTVAGADVSNFGVKRDTAEDASYGPYYESGTTVSYIRQTQSYAPNTPTWTSPTASGQAWDVATGLNLTWVFSDPDPGDTQSAYALRRQIGAGAFAYWRASDSSWQATETQNTSGSTTWLVGGWGTNADATHTYWVKVYDSTGTPSAYSAGMAVVPSSPVNPAITAPTAAQVITSDHVPITWTATEQTKFRVLLSVQGGSQVYDSGWVTDSVSRSYLVPYALTDLTAWTLTLYTTNLEGLASVAQTRNFSVDFVETSQPSLTVTPLPASGVMRVQVNNPNPGGTGGDVYTDTYDDAYAGATPAAFANQDIYRRVVGDTSSGVRLAVNLAVNAIFDDIKAVSGVAYEYRSLARGTNGTSIYSAWTP